MNRPDFTKEEVKMFGGWLAEIFKKLPETERLHFRVEDIYIEFDVAIVDEILTYALENAVDVPTKRITAWPIIT